ncbi:MAG: ABC transporter substrate-binding protein [Chloroflexi bacterium]|nr:ABC transporter substrate-binding protein [Chloroflexota bacterium]
MALHRSIISRRRALVALGGGSLTLLAACGGTPASPTAAPKAAEPTKPAAAAPTTAPTAAPAATKPAEPTKPAAAATTAPTAAAKPQTGGSLTTAELGALTKTLHPYPDNASYTSTWTQAASFIWNGGLLAFDGDTLEYKPDMATAYKVSEDGKTFTFTLRDDLKWSDGSAVTIDDFLFAYEMAKDPKNDYVGLDDVDRIASFTAPDAKTIVVVLKEVFARDIATGVASIIGPVPSKIWKGKPWNDPTGNPEILKPSVLLGPYKIKEFRQAEVATFEPVATHYAGKPSLESITLRPAQQPTVAYELLKSGQAQWAPNIPPAQYEEAKKNPDLVMLEWTPANGSYRNLEFNLTRDFFKDKRVREALARSISREDLIQVAENNLGKPQYSFINPANTKWYNAAVDKYDFDLPRSKTLLEQAGYKLDGGVLKNATGQPVKLSVYYPTTSAPRGKIAAYLQQQFKQLGIELEVRGLDFNAYTDQVGKKKDFDLSLGTYGGGSIDPDLAAKAQLISNGQQNVTGFKNEQVDAAFKAAAVEQDNAKRKAAYDQIQQMVSAELPVFYLYSLLKFSPISKKVSGVRPTKLDDLLGNRAFMTWSVAK